jgi:TRAP-type C4-dicarboxylate transport system substrate-binding protein
MKRLLLLCTIACLLFALAGTALAATEIKLAHVVNEKDAFHLAAEKFKELVEKGSGGELSVTLFPNATLGDERTLLERMKMGVVDMGIITNGPIINFVPTFGAIACPSCSGIPSMPTRSWTAPSARNSSPPWNPRGGRDSPSRNGASGT